MSKIDLDAIQAEVAMAQQASRKMVTLPVGDVISLLYRARELAKVQDFIPFRVGYAQKDDVHLMMQGKKYRIGLQRKKGVRYQVEVLCHYLPDGTRNESRMNIGELIEAEEKSKESLAEA